MWSFFFKVFVEIGPMIGCENEARDTLFVLERADISSSRNSFIERSRMRMICERFRVPYIDFRHPIFIFSVLFIYISDKFNVFRIFSQARLGIKKINFELSNVISVILFQGKNYE